MRIGTVSPDKIVTMEDHDKAYNAWTERNIRNRTLVHVDAHIDFGWIPEIDLDEIGSNGKTPGGSSRERGLLNPFINTRKKMMHIGNYIYPAMRDGIVKKFYWVVPDESWNNRRGLRQITKYLRQILKIEGRANARIEHGRRAIRCRVLGKEVVVCNLENLERVNEEALLDIDVDFMLTRFIWDDLNPKRVPWIFPEELFERLSPKVPSVELLTIAYSVEGGYTPLRFKYLGEEVRSIYAGEFSERSRAMMEIRRRALVLEGERKVREAAEAYEKALTIDNNDASTYFNLSVLNLASTGADARKMASYYLRESLKRDKAYATIYNNYGILYLNNNKSKKAEIEYKKFLQIDEDNISALNGLGYAALSKGRYVSAGEYFDRCIFLDKNHIDARRGKGVSNFKTGRLEEAEKLFSDLKRIEPDNQEIYWWLGQIAEKRGEIALAIDNYKNAVIRGGEGPLVHLLLLRLYVKRGFYYRAFEELKRAIKMTKSLF